MLTYCRAVTAERCDHCNRLIVSGEPIAIDPIRNQLYCSRCEPHPKPEAHVETEPRPQPEPAC